MVVGNFNGIFPNDYSIIGIETRNQLMNRVSLTTRVNVGNFRGRNLSYDAVAAINYEISRYFHISAGYRHQELNYEDDRDLIDMSNTTKGAFVTIAVKF